MDSISTPVPPGGEAAPDAVEQETPQTEATVTPETPVEAPAVETAADKAVDAVAKDAHTLVDEAASHIKEFIDTHIPKLTAFGYAELGELPAKLKEWLADFEKSFGKK